jgi:hypothetical protein
MSVKKYRHPDEKPEDKIEQALLKRALGFVQEESVTEEVIDSETGMVKETAKRRRVSKEVPPDVRALLFWLKNRRPDKWRDKPVDESESATLSAARELLSGIPSVINGGHKP